MASVEIGGASARGEHAVTRAGLVRPPSDQRVGTMTLALLDVFELRFGGETIPLPPSAQRLLALLALHERPLLRPFVAGTLWPETPEDRASANLRSSLWRLNRPGGRVVEATNLQLTLARDVRVDVRETIALAHRLLTGKDGPDGGDLTVDLGRSGLTGELLPDWYDDWVLIERERLRQLNLHALEALGSRQLAANRLGEALETALAAIAMEPLRESAHRLLIDVHLAEGNASEALRQFEFCRRILREQLGLAPSPQLQHLIADLTN
jgi:DNA-binding SARP family transcriptional activator